MKASPVLALIALLAAVLLAVFARGAGPLPGDLAVSRGLQALPGGAGLADLLLLLENMVWLAGGLALLVAVALRRWTAALFLLLGFLGALVVAETVLKAAVVRPRPSTELIAVYEAKDDYGFPSGTVLLGIVIFGSINYLLAASHHWSRIRRGTLAGSLVILALVSLSRVYTGAHWASDVLGGWLWGALCLWLLLAAYRKWTDRYSRRAAASAP